MNLDQDFMDWLKADEENKKNSQGLTVRQRGTGLLLAPINLEQPNDSTEELNDILIPESEEPQQNQQSQETEIPVEITEQIQDIQENIENLENVLQLPEPEEIPQEQPEQEQEEEKAEETENFLPPEFEDPDVDINKAWQERATGFELSLDEPPPEIWTRINESPSEYDDEEEVEYEQGVSLQGAAYIQKREHGKNFTERLQHTLKGRKQRAELLREEEENKKPKHPYIRSTMKKCATLLVTLCLVCFALWFIQRWTPDKMNERAHKFYEQEQYEEAMNLYQDAYKRYPHILTFLTGLAESAEKAGHIQTAQAAWNEYIHFLPEKDTEHKQHAEKELKRLTPQKPKEEEKPKASENKIESVSRDIKLQLPSKPPVVPVTFDEFLTEANKAFNSGMYNVAIIYFFRAMELNRGDVRAYIGLAEAYRLKGMKFDSSRIINEARKIFRANTTIEMIAKFLKEAN